MNSTLENLLSEIVESMKKIYGNKLKKVILYGSYAKGLQDEESDIDIAVLIDLNNDEIRSYTDKIIEATSDVDFKYNKLTSIIDISYNQFMHWVNVVPFYRNIQNEGIVLYEQ